jgi:hypothetical protein
MMMMMMMMMAMMLMLQDVVVMMWQLFKDSQMQVQPTTPTTTPIIQPTFQPGANASSLRHGSKTEPPIMEIPT